MTEDARAIRDLVDAWMAASRTGDIAALLRLMADDVIFMVPGREPFGKDEFRAAADAMRNVRMDGTSDVLEIEVLGECAYLRNYIDLKITPPAGEIMRRRGYTLSILRRQPDGGWLLSRDANLVT